MHHNGRKMQAPASQRAPPVTLRRPEVTAAPLLMSASNAAMPLPLPLPPPAAPGAAPAAAAGLRSASRLLGGGGGGGGGGPPGFFTAAAAAGAADPLAAAPLPAAPALNWEAARPAEFQIGPAGKCFEQKACGQAGGRAGTQPGNPRLLCLFCHDTFLSQGPALPA
jgi:hypothetical protein